MEDFPFDPSLRIPPLLDPQPLLSSRRGPTPLEPNARVNDSSHNSTVKLSSRSKALEDAKPIGDDEGYSTRSGPRGHSDAKAQTTTEVTRKRQKGDYFQLPQPTTKSKHSKPLPFKPVPVLNGLRQPPPSAALFPPITTNGHTNSDEEYIRGTSQSPSKTHSQVQGREESQPATSDPTKSGKTRAKRVCLRGRLKWTDGETEDLMKGVGIYGVGKWKKILHHPNLKFHPDRTMVDLKDRYRTCRMNEEKAIERQAANESQDHTESTTGKKRAKNRDQKQNDCLRDKDDRTEGKEPTDLGVPVTSSPGAKKSSFNIFTPNNFNEQAGNGLKNKKSGYSKPWTPEEDADLSKGYQKYGFQWTAIAKDKDSCLGHRTGAQVRDRFRMKYPVVYQSSVPLPLPEIPKRAPRTWSKRKPSDASQEKDRPLPQRPSSLTFIINKPIKPTVASTPTTPTTNSLTARVETKAPTVHLQARPVPSIADRFSGLDVQPLPDPDPEDDEESDFESLDEGSSESRTRQSTAEADEAHHLSILGLLNDDVQPSSRLPSFKYPFDDEWSTGENVTLPPLHWEQMANRPMFELE